MTLYGSVEGIFDLLVSNDWLSMETTLHYGMELSYNEDFVINTDLPMWFNNKKIIVKNGEHLHTPLDLGEIVKTHFALYHRDILDELSTQSPDERNMFWDNLNVPALMIDHYGQISTLKFALKNSTHLIIDWGDFTLPQVIDSRDLIELEHCYKSSGRHKIILYGDCEFSELDLRKCGGVYYPLRQIVADNFKTSIDNENSNLLIITQ